MATKFAPIIRRISFYMIDRDYKMARHHIRRIWNHMDEMTDAEQNVLREIALIAFNKGV